MPQLMVSANQLVVLPSELSPPSISALPTDHLSDERQRLPREQLR